MLACTHPKHCIPAERCEHEVSFCIAVIAVNMWWLFRLCQHEVSFCIAVIAVNTWWLFRLCQHEVVPQKVSCDTAAFVVCRDMMELQTVPCCIAAVHVAM